MTNQKRTHAKTKHGSRSRVTKEGGLTKGVNKKPDSHSEAWRIVTKGRRKTVVTRRKSIAAMDDAVGRYAKALRRLADR